MKLAVGSTARAVNLVTLCDNKQERIDAQVSKQKIKEI
jgi:hypothetical protein